MIKHFTECNDISVHVKIRAVKPLKKNIEKYQVFCSVSNDFRKLLKNNNDKVMFGLNSCKVYDQHNVKRCFNCQNFGHYASSCPNSTQPICAKCSLSHQTNTCNSDDLKCVNCIRNNLPDLCHAASDHQCPLFLEALQNVKSDKKLN